MMQAIHLSYFIYFHISLSYGKKKLFYDFTLE